MSLVEDFFRNIIPATLDEPVNATLELQDGQESISAIVIPRIDGGLVLDFYDAVYDDAKIGITVSGHGRLWRGSDEMRPVVVRFRNNRAVEAMVTTLGGSAISGDGKRSPAKGRLVVTQNRFTVMESPVKHARLCIEDFPMFLGDGAMYPHTTGDYVSMLGRSEIEADGWSIIIEECAETDNEDFGVTHTGEIARTDGNDFSVADLNRLCDGLTQFFTFITGVYRTLSVTIGYDDAGRYVWGRIGRFNQSKYLGDNWFSRHKGASIATLLPGFWRCINNDKSGIQNLIGSYAQSSMIAHMRLAMFPIALRESQSALEGLSKLVLGRKKQRREPAGDYIREALCTSGIGHDLSDFPSLMRVWRKYKTSEDDDAGPTFITRLRNRATHPTPDEEMGIRDYYEAWRLSQRYAELMMLRLFAYQGEYRDRLTGETKSVPWAACKG